MAVGVRRAVCVGLQAGSVGHDVCHVVLLLHPVEQVSHWPFGVDGHVLSTVRLRIQWDSCLLHVLLIICREISRGWNVSKHCGGS